MTHVRRNELARATIRPRHDYGFVLGKQPTVSLKRSLQRTERLARRCGIRFTRFHVEPE